MNASTADDLEGAAGGAFVWVRIVGRGSFKMGPALKAFASGAIRNGGRRLVVELADCLVMDSTCIGILTGLAMQLKTMGGAVELRHANGKNRESLATMGLDGLFDMPTVSDPDAMTMPPLRRLETGLDAATAESILAAHQSLIAAAPENQARFNDVVTQLKEEIQYEHENIRPAD